MTDIRDLAPRARTTSPSPIGSSAIRASPPCPGSSFFSHPELGRTKLRFAFPKRLETLTAAAERLARLTGPRQPAGDPGTTEPTTSVDGAPRVGPVVAQERVGSSASFADRAADPRVEHRVDRPGAVRLEGQRDRVGAAGIEDVG